MNWLKQSDAEEWKLIIVLIINALWNIVIGLGFAGYSCNF